MTFQAYLDNIEKKTGKRPQDFHKAAAAKGILGPDLTATQLTDWLKADYGLGHGHAMAMWAAFKQYGWAETPGSKSSGAKSSKGKK